MMPARHDPAARGETGRLGIYMQVPFCRSKCTYCNFHTGVFSKAIYAPYVEAMRREIRASMSLRSLPVDTVYIGGGTPSLLEPSQLANLLETVALEYPGRFEEVTLEADPETITAEKALAWRGAGINRVSLGAQSFCDAELRASGRRHRREEIHQAARLLRSAGFDNISMDLIAGLPHQDEASWGASIDALTGLRPEHVSIYLLEVDEESRLGREIIRGGGRYRAQTVPSDDAMADFYEGACERLAAAGYVHYEISNWALPGRSSKHNLKYWRREPYLGFGAGAHSFDGRKRWANVHDPAAYTAATQKGRSTIEQEETATERQALDEELFLGLRQLEGVDLGDIEKKHGVNLRSRLQRLRDDRLIEIEGERLRIHPAKLTIANEVFVAVMGLADEPEARTAGLI